MADTVQIRAGAKAAMPQLGDRELGWARDEKGLYIGTPGNNVKITGQVEEAILALAETVETLEDTIGALEDTTEALGSSKLTATPAEAQTNVAADADLGTVITAVNALMAAMRASGLMTIAESEVTT